MLIGHADAGKGKRRKDKERGKKTKKDSPRARRKRLNNGSRLGNDLRQQFEKGNFLRSGGAPVRTSPEIIQANQSVLDKYAIEQGAEKITKGKLTNAFRRLGLPSNKAHVKETMARAAPKGGNMDLDEFVITMAMKLNEAYGIDSPNPRLYAREILRLDEVENYLRAKMNY